MYGAQINPRGCENDLCINLNNCFQWDKAVCGKRKRRMLQELNSAEDFRRRGS